MILTRVREAFQTPWKRTLYIIFFAQMMTSVGFSIIFPFLPLYLEDLGSSTNLSIELLAGLVYSGQALSMMIASPFWGMMADRVGRKPMVLRAMFGGSVIMLGMAFVTSAEQLVLIRVIQGFVTGTVSAANALVASAAPREKIGQVMGTLHVGLAGGVSIGPVIGGAMADWLGYGAVFYITAMLLLLSGLLVLFGVREDFQPEVDEGQKRENIFTKWKNLLRQKGVMMTYSLRFMTRLGHLMIIPLIPLFAQQLVKDQSIINTTTGLIIGSAFITNAIFSAFLGRLGDRIGYRKVLVTSSVIAGLLYIPQSMVTETWQLIVLQGLFGITLGGMIPAISSLLANYTKTGQEGAVYGLDNSVLSGARAVAPLIGAGVALLFGDFRPAFLFSTATFFLAATLAAILLPPSREQQNQTQ